VGSGSILDLTIFVGENELHLELIEYKVPLHLQLHYTKSSASQKDIRSAEM